MTSSIGFFATLITPANFFVAALYDTSDTSTVLESQQVPKSGGSYLPNFEVTFLYNLQQDKVYRVILWENPGSAPAGVSRGSHDFKASLNSIKMRGSLYLEADVDAGLTSGTSGYVDPTNSLEGWVYDLEEVGYGTLRNGLTFDYTLDGTTNNWSYTGGRLVAPNQKYVLHFQAQVSAAPQPPISAISTGRTITASTTLTSSDKNKALYIQASGSSITITAMALSAMADYDHLVIYSRGGNHKNVILQFPGTDKLQLDTLVTKVILGQAEKLDIFKANGQWELEYISPSYWMVGQYIYRPTKGEVNTLFADGTPISRSIYPRITDYALNKLSATERVAEASWAATAGEDGVTRFPNKGFWTTGDGLTTIHLPLLYDTGFLRGVDGMTRYAGSQQMDALFDFQMDSLISLIGTNGQGTSKGFTGKYGGNTSGFTDLSSHPGRVVGGAFQVLTRRDNAETRPINTGAYISICI